MGILESLLRRWDAACASRPSRARSSEERDAFAAGINAALAMLDPPGAVSYAITEYPLEVAHGSIILRTRLRTFPEGNDLHAHQEIPLDTLKFFSGSSAEDLLVRHRNDMVTSLDRGLNKRRYEDLCKELSSMDLQYDS